MNNATRVLDKAQVWREFDPSMQCVMPRLGRGKGHFPDFPGRFKASSHGE